jgi:hypothetical protein
MAENPLHGTHASPDDEGFDRELSVAGIVWTAAGILAVTVAAMVLMWWMVNSLKDDLTAGDPELPAVERLRREAAAGDTPTLPSGPPLPAGVRLPPGPRLQPKPEDEMAALHERQLRLLTSYGWVDREAGTVRVPIERAMAELAAGGLPAAEPAAGAAEAEPAAGTAAEPAAADGAARGGR